MSIVLRKLPDIRVVERVDVACINEKAGALVPRVIIEESRECQWAGQKGRVRKRLLQVVPFYLAKEVQCQRVSLAHIEERVVIGPDEVGYGFGRILQKDAAAALESRHHGKEPVGVEEKDIPVDVEPPVAYVMATRKMSLASPRFLAALYSDGACFTEHSAR